MGDPWVITPAEKAKHMESFQSIGPIGGFIAGEQAKKFFLQSQLPPQVLGIIWMLSDLDGDGRMNCNEFSIACKLINLKLRGFAIPQSLPVSLKQSAMLVPAPAMPTPPTSNQQVRPNSVTSTPQSGVTTPPKRPVEKQISTEWAIPQATKLKFSQVFDMSDRNKTGFISGVQARNILLQSSLPQATLAKIWYVKLVLVINILYFFYVRQLF